MEDLQLPPEASPTAVPPPPPPPPAAKPTTEPPSKRIDLDAARRARAEKRGQRPFIVFFGERYDLPYAMPAEVIDVIGLLNREGDWSGLTDAFRVLIGGADVYDAIASKAKAEGEPLELDDVLFLLESCLEVYEVNLPKSARSLPQS